MTNDERKKNHIEKIPRNKWLFYTIKFFPSNFVDFYWLIKHGWRKVCKMWINRAQRLKSCDSCCFEIWFRYFFVNYERWKQKRKHRRAIRIHTLVFVCFFFVCSLCSINPSSRPYTICAFESYKLLMWRTRIDKSVNVRSKQMRISSFVCVCFVFLVRVASANLYRLDV